MNVKQKKAPSQMDAWTRESIVGLFKVNVLKSFMNIIV